MRSPLFRKEWRQLRTLRVAGIVLGAAMPAIAAAGAEAGRRGWLPWGPSRGWTTHEVFGELAPALVLVGVWPLLTLLFTAQAFAGDRASGTEAFLLERPVPRARIWWARLLVSLASSALLAAIAGGLVLVVGAISVGTGTLDGSLLGGFALSGLAVSFVLATGAMAATAVLKSPVGAVLLGLLLGAVPAVLAMFLAGAFPYAAIGYFPIGAAIPWILLPGYVAASWTASARGEPAGRGSVKRAVRATASAGLVGALTFLACAPVASRHPTRDWYSGVPAPSGRTIAFGGGWYPGGAVHLLDTERAAVLRRLPAPIFAEAWDDAGKDVFVVATAAGPFGSEQDEMRFETYRADGSVEPRGFPPIREHVLRRLVFSDDRLVALTIRVRGDATDSALLTATSNDRAWDSIELPSKGRHVEIVQSSRGGFLVRADPLRGRDDSSSRDDPAEILVFRWTDSRPELAIRRETRLRSFGVNDPWSPSGRYLVLSSVTSETAEGRQVWLRRPVVLDLETGDERVLPGRATWTTWLAGDRLIWAVRGTEEQAVFAGTPDGAPTLLRAWSGARVHVTASPDDRLVLVSVSPRTKDEDPVPEVLRDRFGPVPWEEGGAPAVTGPELWIFDPESGTWTALEPWPAPGASEDGWSHVGWAGPRRIVRTDQDTVAFESLDRPGELVYARGGPD